MDAIAGIGKVIEGIALNYPLGPIIVLASLYFIYDGYKTTNNAQMFFAAVALLWSLFTLFSFVMR